MSPAERSGVQKRMVLIGGKAASAYRNAKIIIKLINNVSKVINNDPDTSPYLKCAFVPNYCVTAAEVMVPASDISEHISTAGTEASGTSNMKFVMNGGLIVGTMDGANIEIREEGGEDTMFIFGALEHEVPAISARAKAGDYAIDPRLQAVFDAIRGDQFSQGEPDAHGEFCEIVDKLCNIHAAGTWDGDRYLVIHDFPSFVDAQARVDAIYSKDKAKWCSLSIQAAASMAKFSTDRTISEYSSVIWGVKPAPRPLDASASSTKVSGPDGKAAAKKTA
jgi:starch phosphorylase